MSAPAKKRSRNFVAVGQVKVRWYKNAGRTFIDARKYGRKLFSKTDHAEALREAQRIALEINAGGIEVLALTPADRASYAKAAAEAAKHGTDVTHAIMEWSSARALLGGRSLTSIVEAGLAALTRPTHPTSDIVAKFLQAAAGKTQDGRQRGQMKSILTKFAGSFPATLQEIKQAELEKWLADLRRRDDRPISPKTRTHWRAAIVQLFKFARDRGYLPDVKTEAAKVPKDSARRRLICGIFAPAEYRELRDRGLHVAGIFTPADIEQILRHAEEEDLPWLALNAFSGARVEEIGRSRHARSDKDWIRWEDFDWNCVQDKHAWHGAELTIRSEVSKTGKLRRIPISRNLVELLTPYRAKRGLVVPGSVDAARDRVKAKLRSLAKDSDEFRGRIVHWPDNGLRHSYGSYRMAITQNLNQVAYEMGNSVAMVQAHYHNPRPREEALAWFNVTAHVGQKVIQLDMKALRAAAR